MNRFALLAALTIMPGVATAQCIPDIVKITSWEIVPVDSETNTLSTSFEIVSPKPVRMIEAQLVFFEPLGGRIGPMSLSRDIPANGQWDQTNRWGPNTFERLLDLRRDEISAEVCVTAVLYDNGDVLRADDL